jgi:hypothetical protein
LTAEDPKNLSQLTPGMVIQDIETVGVPDLDHLSEVSITNHQPFLQVPAVTEERPVKYV